MSKATEILFPTVQQLHEQTLKAATDSLRSQGLQSAPHDIEYIELALLAFKSLSKMLVYGFRDPSEAESTKVSFCLGHNFLID